MQREERRHLPALSSHTPRTALATGTRPGPPTREELGHGLLLVPWLVFLLSSQAFASF